MTPDLDGSILPGVTRDSILSLARQWGEFKVSERKVNMKDLLKADKEGRIIEMFGKLWKSCCPKKRLRLLMWVTTKQSI